MKRKSAYFFGLICLIAVLSVSIACNHKKTEPKRYLSEEQMIEILVDVHITEATLSASQNLGFNADSLSVQLYAQLFDKHGVSRDRYENSLKHYMENPEKMDEIYEQVYNRLTALQTEIHTKHNIEQDQYE